MGTLAMQLADTNVVSELMRKRPDAGATHPLLITDQQDLGRR